MEKAEIITAQAKSKAAGLGTSGSLCVHTHMLVHMLTTAHVGQPTHMSTYTQTGMHTGTHMHSHLHTHPTLGSSNPDFDMTVSFVNPFTGQLPFPVAWTGFAAPDMRLVSIPPCFYTLHYLEGR